MFLLGIFLGLYANSIYFLGLLNLLSIFTVGIITIVYFVLWIYFHRPKLTRFKNEIIGKYNFVLLGLLLTMALVNLIGALGPELAFDALWYHLTIPKVYHQSHNIFYIPGGLLYYSAMPKLGEMFYLAALFLGNEITAKTIHYLFGLLIVLAIYKFGRNFFTVSLSLIVCIVFYANLVVAWESTTAYIDLIRTFFELMALWLFVVWCKKMQLKWLIISAIFCGFALSTKLLAFGSLLIFSILIIFRLIKDRSKFNILSDILVYWTVALGVLSPWLIFSFVNTGNPVYPIFSGYGISYTPDTWNPIRFFQDTIQLLLFADDPLSPVYLMVIPLVILFFSKFSKDLKIIMLYSLCAIVVWYFTPRTGGGRFILPYLPAFSLIVGEVIRVVEKKPLIKNTLIVSILFIAVITIAYRGVANARYLPVLLGQQTKKEFLTTNLNFKFGDFYDTDDYFTDNLKPGEKVLLIGFHNLYYVNFPYIHESWIKKGDEFNYIATQETELPERFKNWKLIYENDQTGVKVYGEGEEYRY